MSIHLYDENINDVMVFDLSTEGLEPLQHRIIGVTTKTVKEERIFTDRDEKILLESFWNYIKENNFNRIVGFNSDCFDIPMLITRSIKHRVSIAKIKGKCIDVRKKITYKKGTLDDFRQLLGIEFPESRYAKMHMSLLWEDDNLNNLKDFLLRDVRVTWELYKHVDEAGL